MSRKKTESRVADPIVKRRIVITPEAGESWYWLCDAGATITDRSDLIAHTGSKSAPRYRLFWEYDLTLEYRDDLGGCRWREDWMEYIAGIKPCEDKNDPLVFRREYLVQYKPSIFDSVVCQSRLGIYAYSGKFRVIQVRRFLPGITRHNHEDVLYAPEVLATVVGHLVEHCVPGIDKRTMVWLVRYGVPPWRDAWDHHFYYWQLMHCKWDCLEGEWWVTDCEFEEAPSHVIHNILWG